jgi:uncharacterized protein YcaQ
VIRARLEAQLLSGTPARDPVAVAERLLAIQGQDPRGARLAIRARTTGLTAADVDRALTEDRSLLITWLNRGTLHLVRSEDYPWLHALTTPPLRAGCARRLEQEGVTPAATGRAVGAIERALGDEGPLTRAQLRERIDAVGVRTEGQALVHLLVAATLDRVAIRGPMAGRQHAYALVSDWLPPAPRVDRDAALAELARRFLAGHGPADERDLAKWTGMPLRDARAGLAAIASSLVELPSGLVDLRGRGEPSELPPPRLLGPFDPLLHGWVSRRDVLGEHKEIVTTNGVFRPFALAGGRAVGTWTMPAGKVELAPFGRLRRDVRAALERDAVELARFLT